MSDMSNPEDWARRGQQLGELRQENYQLKQRIAELEGAIGLERIAAHKLEAENQRLRDAAPEYKIVKQAIALADAEYVGQAWAPLWEWAWKEAKALLGGGHE